MTDSNPFVHPAQTRLQALIDEAEQEIISQDQPFYDPLERFQSAREWGVDPWVAAMLPVSQEMNTLQGLAVGVAPDEGVAKSSLMSVVTHSLQALALFEEDQNADQVLDDSQLADFLGRLVDQLDSRIEKLRGSKVEAKDEDWAPTAQGEPLSPEGPGMEPDEVKQAILDGEQEFARGGGKNQDEVISTRPSRLVEDAHHVELEEEPMPPLVDLDAADRAFARETAALRVSAGGSSAAQLGGRHQSPADTDPDMGATGRRARDEET